MLVASWNVNSIRVRLKGIVDLINKYQPDILCLQEIKCENEYFPIDTFTNLNYYAYINGQKTYNGVAILSKYKLDEIVYNFTSNDALASQNSSLASQNSSLASQNALEARYIQAKLNFQNLYFGSIYVPNGGMSTEKYDNKLQFLNNLYNFLQNFKNEKFILCGDFNVAPFDIDVFSVEKTFNSALCTELERALLRKIFDLLDDSFRIYKPFVQEFSWWDYRDYCFLKNAGLRLDLILTSHQITKNLKKAWMDKEFRSHDKPSDHIPCLIEFII